MMLGGNLVACGITTMSIIFRWEKVSSSFVILITKPDALLRVFGLAMCGALGQFCIYYAIKAFGALTFTWMMTARQLLSVVISLVWFRHGVTPTKVVCIGVVFAVLSARQLAGANKYAVAKLKETKKKLVKRFSQNFDENATGSKDQPDDTTPKENGTEEGSYPRRRRRSGTQPIDENGS